VLFRSLPPRLAAFFPEVLHEGSHDGRIWYEMPFYNLPSLRWLLQVGDISADSALDLCASVLGLLCDDLYTRKRGPAGVSWFVGRHLDRVNRRLFYLASRCAKMKQLMDADQIVLNGRTCRNLPYWLMQIGSRSTLLKALAPTGLCDVHGDLHFQNILVDHRRRSPEFLLMDPRGDLEGSDLFYDLGKLWHSCHGLYDFIHTDQTHVTLEWNERSVSATMEFNNAAALENYRRVAEGLPQVIESLPLIAGDPQWRMKTAFAEAMHFSSVMPFHLRYDDVEVRATALYLTAVRLLDGFCRDFEVEDLYPIDRQYFNINNYDEYELLLNASTEF